ncbi:radical SAM protein [Chakrabartyella piscis]|uniref:radical SAM protein n=1 Tax=Chakrabartyella piscis TaxID=2918914 RepID=UPI002958D33A|nr:radical SAM protein [Chakrabartyella piscis]
MEEHIFQVGPIRPPSEANSLLLRVTENCPWNKCKFCMLYKNSQFHTRLVAEIIHDVDVMAEYRDRILTHFDGVNYNMGSLQNEYINLDTDAERMCYQMVFTWLTEGNRQAIFLQDANTMVLKAEWLAEIITHIRKRFPEIERITSYGRADSLSRITKENMKLLADAGLNRVHSGFESGSDRVLDLIQKGTTQEQEIIGGCNVRDAGIELSIYFMPGVGGKALAEENAIETAKVINLVNPDFVRLRTFVLRTGSLMEDLQKTGAYQVQTDMEKLLEIRNLIAHVDPTKASGMLKSDHIINLLQEIEGKFDTDIPNMLEYIDTFLALPEQQQKEYQLARRMGFPLDWRFLYRMNEADRKRVSDLAKNTVSKNEWEALLHRFTDRYI